MAWLAPIFLGLAFEATAARGYAQQVGTFATMPSRVHDLTTGITGNLLYCTEQREVGKINLQKQVAIIADGTTGPFTNALRGIRQLQNGDISVIDAVGDIYRLPAGQAPGIKVYSDLYMISDPTDLLVDGAGNYVTVSQSPSSGFKAINWISSDGQNWAYYLVKHQPCAIAQDPVSGNLYIADQANGGVLRLIDANDDSHPTSALDSTTHFGFTSANNDGDMAVESNGNILIVALGTLYRYDHTSGTTSVVVNGLGNLHAITIAASSGDMPSSTGFSAYVAQGTGPTTILEITEAHGPASLFGPSLGTVQSRGNPVSVNFGMNVFEMSRDVTSGSLLIGGDAWGLNPAVKRVNLSTFQVTTIANDTNGIQSRVMGLSVGQDSAGQNAIYAGTVDGYIHKIVESPLSVTTLFADPNDAVAIAEDMIRDRNGAFWIANRTNWATGYITRVQDGVLTNLTSTVETRGLMADPFTGRVAFSEWINIGFNGRVDLFNNANNTFDPIPGFEGVNYSNAGVWADGDMCEDVQGNIYTCSEDDFSIYRFNRASGKLVRIAAGYLNHPAGVVIAKSTAGSGSVTGWSLYVAEYFYLWEIPNVAAPAPTLLDPGAPGIGHSLGYFPPSTGTLRAITRNPSGSGFFVSTAGGTIERMLMTGVRQQVAGSAQGLTGDLVAITTNSSGHLLVANRAGKVFDVDPNNGYAAVVVYANSGNQLSDVRSLAVDAQGRLLVADQPAALGSAAKWYRIESGQLTLLAITHRGYRAAADPLTGDWFIPEGGSPGDGGGEVLRVDAFASPATAGHYRGAGYFTLPVGAFDGAIAFNSEGDFYVACAATGRVMQVSRATGAVTTLAGNYMNPVGLAVAPGTVGVAGPQGTSLYVLDDVAIHEVGIPGSPPPAPAPVQPNLGSGADLKVSGSVQLGGATLIQVNSIPDANRVYLVVASLSGKTPGFPLNTFGDPSDTRVIPNNPDDVWQFVNSPQVMPDFYGILDGSGKSSPFMSLVLPNDPSLLFGQFLDFAWVSFDPSAPNGFATVGGTAQIYLGN